MPRTADVSALAEAGKQLLTLVAPNMDENDLESLQFDVDSIGVLLVEFDFTKLAHENVQWVLWHLLEHVMQDLDAVSSQVPDGKLDDFYDAYDTYVEAFEERLTSRAKITCSRLDALLTSYWAEADEEPAVGTKPVSKASLPDPDPDEDEDEDGDEDGDEDEDETGNLEEETDADAR